MPKLFVRIRSVVWLEELRRKEQFPEVYYIQQMPLSLYSKEIEAFEKRFASAKI
jgi:hypothetical protein